MAKFKFKNIKCEDVARTFVIGINVIFLLLGLAIMIVAIVLSNKFTSIKTSAKLLSDLDVQIIAIIIAVASALIFAISICGLAGAIKRWRKCLIFYAAMLFIVIAIQLAMGIYLKTLNADTLQQKWENSTPNDRLDVQNYLDCCGWINNDDAVPYPGCSGHTIPVSSCQQKTLDFIDDNIEPVAIASIVIAAIELLSLTATCALIFTRKDIKDEFYDDQFWS